MERFLEDSDAALLDAESLPRELVPPEFRVVLINDDYTTKDFVVDVLKSVFAKPEGEAVRLMELVHRRGSAAVGTYVQDVAQSLVLQTERRAREASFPLVCRMEPV